MVPTEPRFWPCILLILTGAYAEAQSPPPALPDQESRALALLAGDPMAAALVIDSLCSDPLIKDRALRCAYLQAALLARTGQLSAGNYLLVLQQVNKVPLVVKLVKQ